MIDDRATEADLDRALALMDAPEPTAPRNGHAAHTNGNSEFNHRLHVAKWLRDSGIEFIEKRASDRTIYSITCPFNSEHRNEANITQHSNGGTSAGCFHASCANNKWPEFRDAIGKPRAEHYDPPLTPKTTSTESSSQTAIASERKRFRIDSIDSAQFAAATYDLRFLIRKIFVADQPWIVGGAQKSLKTSIATDAVISLGTGTPFLGEFYVPEPVAVGFISAESGMYTLQAKAKQIAHQRGRLLSSALVHWYFQSVQLGVAEHIDAISDWIRERELKVIVIDPAYLCMAVGDNGQPINFGNLFDVGAVLSRFTSRFLELGCTPAILHHESKGANSFRRRGDYGPPELSDLSMAGFAEWARQWMLLARREAYEQGSGVHRLWLNAGGSAGHGGLWAIDVDEGQLQDDFSGRTWNVTVSTGTEARKISDDDKEAIAARRKADKAAKQAAEDGAKVQAALEAIPVGMTFTQIRKRTNVADDRLHALLTAWCDKGVIEACQFTGANKQVYDGYRIVNLGRPVASVGPVEPPVLLLPPHRAPAPVEEGALI